MNSNVQQVFSEVSQAIDLIETSLARYNAHPIPANQQSLLTHMATVQIRLLQGLLSVFVEFSQADDVG